MALIHFLVFTQAISTLPKEEEKRRRKEIETVIRDLERRGVARDRLENEAVRFLVERENRRDGIQG